VFEEIGDYKISFQLQDSITESSDIKIVQSGDINIDETINVQDVVSAVGFILSSNLSAPSYPSQWFTVPFPLSMQLGDINGDSNMDILDVIMQVNLVLGN